KLDRKALPAPESDAYVTREYEAPVGEVENTLAQIWSDVLKLECVGRHDHFFDLGGHSLLAVTLVSRLRSTLGIDIAVRDVFACPAVKSLPQKIAGATRGPKMSAQRVSRPAMLPLSYAQQRLWFLAQMEGGSQAYHIPIGLRLTGELDRRALQRALDRILWRH